MGGRARRRDEKRLVFSSSLANTVMHINFLTQSRTAFRIAGIENTSGLKIAPIGSKLRRRNVVTNFSTVALSQRITRKEYNVLIYTILSQVYISCIIYIHVQI